MADEIVTARTLIHELLRAIRGPVFVLALVLFAARGAAAQGSPGGSSSLSEPEFMRWAATQGGLLIALLVTGWSYRRDLVTLVEQERQRTTVLTNLVEKSTEALTHMADAVDGCPLRDDRSERDYADR